MSKFLQYLFKAMGTSLSMSTAYHPQLDGQIEALNKCLELYLRCFVLENPNKWVEILPWAQYWYKTTFHRSVAMSPSKIVYGRNPPKLISYSSNDQDPLEVVSMLQHRDKVLTQLKKNLLKAQDRMKRMADKHRTEVSFIAGEWVFVKLQPYRQHSLVLRKNKKLGMRYFGPFRIVQKIRTQAYKLQLPNETQIHPVFHISLLKKSIGDPSKVTSSVPLPLLRTYQGTLLQPEKILQFRNILHNGKSIWQALM